MKKAIIAATSALLFAICSCNGNKNNTTDNAASNAAHVEIQQLTDEQFTQLVGYPENDAKTWNFATDKPIVVDFHATWCGPCKKLAPNIQKLANEYNGKITVYKVDVDKAQRTAATFGISSIPTILFFNPATKQVGGQSGYQDYYDLKAYVKEALGVE